MTFALKLMVLQNGYFLAIGLWFGVMASCSSEASLPAEDCVLLVLLCLILRLSLFSISSRALSINLSIMLEYNQSCFLCMFYILFNETELLTVGA